MKKINKLIAALTVAAMTATTAVPVMAQTEVTADTGSSVTAEEMTQAGEYADDQVLVVFDDSVKDSRIQKTLESEGTECLEITETSAETKVAVAEIEGNDTVEDAITKLSENDRVLYAQPNYRYEVLDDTGTNDPYNNDEGVSQWYLSNIKAREAWAVMKTAELEPVTVAVVDTGADVNHEDLKNMIHEKSARIEGSEIKKLEGDSSYEGHGTHVSGIIAAESNNGKGITGVASGAGNGVVKLMVIDATCQDAPGEYFDTYGIVSAIDYAVENGAKVINMSLGGEGVDLVMEEAVQHAFASGVTVVAAAGNEGTDATVTPSDCNETISVCNTTREDRRYEAADLFGVSGSNYGQAKDISAPGTTIISTIPKGYDNYTGTSMATPMVTAAAAMVCAVNPDLTPAQVKNILCGTARDIDEEGFDYYTGYGVVNIYDAVNAALEANAETAVTSIEFKEVADYVKRIDVKESEMLEVLIRPAASLAAVTWTSSNEDVVTVDASGTIYGKSAGTATITCTAGGISASCNVEVCDVNLPETLTITNAEKFAEMEVDQWNYLETSVTPRYADNTKVFWKSSDKSVVTIDELGLVTARGVGEAQIMGYVYNSSYKSFETLPEEGDPLTAVIDVKVMESVKSIQLINAPAKVKMGTKVTFTAKATPETAKGTEIYWTSSNRSVADIDSKTGEVTPVSPGKTTISATTDNGKAASVRITVYKTDYSKKAYSLKAKSAGYKSVKLTWNAIPNADGYRIYRNGKAIKDVASTTYTNKKLTCGKKYKYSVCAYYIVNGQKELCSASAVKTAKPVPAAPTVKAKGSKGKITLSWSKVKGASKYVVYKYNKDKKKYVKVATVKAGAYKDTSVKKGKTYKYKVRTYRTVSGKKVYGQYSKVVKKTAK